MAIVQISRVQVRRGRKNSGTSVPQLASGELGWAIDARELYIGNGSVAEGAPTVGNTKILTEHDDLLQLIGQYAYRNVDGSGIQTGSDTTPVFRSIQDRLDDHVTIKSFGAVGNGVYNKLTNTYTLITDDTASIQRAIDQLYLNDTSEGLPKGRVVLELPPGIYTISDSLKIPPYATLRGAGKDKTIIVQTGNYPVIQTVGSTTTNVAGYVGLINMDLENQPRFIEICDLTLATTVETDPIAVLNATVNSVFCNVKFLGSWEVDVDAPSTVLVENNCGVQLVARSNPVTCKDNIFDSCDFVNLSYGINSTYDITSNVFKECLFEFCGVGVIFGQSIDALVAGRQVGPSQNKFIDSKFVDILRYGIKIDAGQSNSSSNNKYISVGNDGGDSRTAAYPVLYFSDASNVSFNDYFERSTQLTYKVGYNASRYISEVSGKVTSDHKYNTQIMLSPNTLNSTLMRLPGNESSRIRVHYVYHSDINSLIRQGTMYILVDKFNDNVSITDEFDVIGSLSLREALSFKVTLEDMAKQDEQVGDGNPETIFVKYTNAVSAEDGYINYWYEILS